MPYEPYFTISRFFNQDKEHYWAIYPNILQYYFGKPILEKYMHFGREYVGLYKNG